MKKSYLLVLIYSLLFLFLIQMVGTLVESIYILDLLHTSLDEKALGLFFFFAPVIFIPVRNRIPGWVTWLLVGLLVAARGVTPYLDTAGRLVASGIGTGTALCLVLILVGMKPKGESQALSGIWLSSGLALAVGLSVLLRTINFSLDYSMSLGGGWLGWLLGLLFIAGLTQMELISTPPGQMPTKGLTSAVFGFMMILTLVYFVFSAPAVLARWTEGSYIWIVTSVSLLTLGWILVNVLRPGYFYRIPKYVLLAWNILFILALVETILANRVSFPLTPDAAPVAVGSPSWMQQIPLVGMLVLFPLIFVDMGLFSNTIHKAKPTPRAMIPGMLLGSFGMVVLIFIMIFTNTWGYIDPISTPFRNMFWLPFALMAGIITILVLFHDKGESFPGSYKGRNTAWVPAAFLGAIFLGTAISAFLTDNVHPVDQNKTSLTVMTYNIQEANDKQGERSYKRQLALIRQVSPDILAIQEGDSARISLNNNDYVRYYASKLGYYSYYGPTTVTGTFGTAILSKFPLENTHTVFSFSDTDEIGTAVAQVNVDGQLFTIFCVHPDGSDIAKVAFAKTLLDISKDKANVIALGDFNLRDTEKAYQMVNEVYKNAWISAYPGGISTDGLDMTGRIDHIFVSSHLGIRNPVYVLPPASATDHPAHWTEIFWGK